MISPRVPLLPPSLQRARCVPFGWTNSVMMQSISITSLCLCMCSIAGQLNLSSVMVLRKGVCSVFKPLTLRLAVHVHTGQGKKVMRATLYSGIELQLAWSKVSTKVCGFTFGSISLHLISKGIKKILTQKHQCNAKYSSQFNYKNAFIFSGFFSRFQLYAQAYVRISTCTLHSWQQK